MRRVIIILFFLFAIISVSRATHMRAGEITYAWKGGLTYQITIITYTNSLSLADRPDYTISCGDGTTTDIPRLDKTYLGNNINRNTYIGQHTYPAPSTYIISLEDPNRNAGILNIPNSVNVPFYIQTILVINPFLGTDNSPVILNPPIDNACVNIPYMYNPGAYDVDGDSLSYQLVNCKGQDGLDIPGYTFPPASNYFGINPVTGDMLWNSPEQEGQYNVAILIKEWRYGQLIGIVTIDMQITVVACNDHPPVIADLNDTCVLAGTLLTFNVTATDPDANNIVTLSATGGPFMVSISPATFPTVIHTDTVTSTFTWQTTCDHVQQQPYSVLFKASDNSIPVNLMALKTVMITIVAPAPPNLTAVPLGNTIHLKWNKSPCPNAIGYKIYRRNGFYGYVHGPCETGVPAYTGYVKIATQSGVNDTTFIDTDNGNGLIHGLDYCYMVIAYFSDGAESYASNEACSTLIKDVPIITNVSVNVTDAANGVMYIAWSKPTQLDTVQAPGPYKYLIYHSNDLSGYNLTLIDSLDNLNDTTYLDQPLNTFGSPWSYRINLWNETTGSSFLIGLTEKASSVFVSLTPSDHQLTLDFAPIVSWINDTFVVYRKNSVTLLFDSIGFSTTPHYVDKNLVNGRTYCYKVKSIGHYYALGLIDPIINYSQEVCGVPIDKTPPCPPFLSVIPDCDKVQNSLIWANLIHSCANDITHYNIYYSPTNNSELELITTINNPQDTFYLHKNLQSIAGCYAVSAVDSSGNESQLSNIVCLDIDSCSLYELPNVFTPNGDGNNDYFKPFPFKFVEKINLQVFNRWGKLVFTTQDPYINWNGKDKYSNRDCSEGVYFFICDVYEFKLSGIKKRTINGVIHLLRGK